MKRRFGLSLAVTLYTALAGLANPALAGEDWSAVEALRTGDMKKLMFVGDPTPIPATKFVDEAGVPMSMERFQGEWVVLNFWATWCAPCRAEMPTLANLQENFDGLPARVVTVATGRNAPVGIARFFDEIGVDDLPEYRDPKQALARDMGVFGLPITVIIDPEGREVARLRGDAHWDSESALNIMQALIENH